MSGGVIAATRGSAPVAPTDTPSPVLVVADDLLGAGGEAACELVVALRVLGLQVHPVTIATGLRPSAAAAAVGPVLVLAESERADGLDSLARRLGAGVAVPFGGRARLLLARARMVACVAAPSGTDALDTARRVAGSLPANTQGRLARDADRLAVSVVIPVHDRQDSIVRAVESVRRQAPLPVDEIVVVDDASSDRSAEVAEQLGCRVVRLPVNGGAAAARNAGLRAASNPWVAFLDSDDEWLAHHLATLWGQRFGARLVAGCALVRTPGRPDRFEGPARLRGLTRIESPATLVHPHNVVSMSSVMVRRDAMLAIDGFDASIRYSEDLDAWLRLLADGGGTIVPSPTAVVHRHPGNKSMQRVGPRESQAEIARSYADAPWWSPRLVEGRLAAAAWDDMRTRLRESDRSGALRRARYIASSRERVRGLADVLQLRLANRLHSRRFGSDGIRRVVAAPGEAGRVARALGRDAGVLRDEGGTGAVLSGQAVLATRRPPLAALARAVGIKTMVFEDG